MSAVFFLAAYWYWRQGVNAIDTKVSCHLLASVAWFP